MDETDFEEVKYLTSKYVRWWIDKAIASGGTIEQDQECVAEDYRISVEELRRRYPEASKGTPGLEEAISAPPRWLTTDYVIDNIREHLDDIVAKRYTGWLGIRFHEGVLKNVIKKMPPAGD